MEDTEINGVLVYKLQLNTDKNNPKFLLWAFDEFDGSKVCECAEQLTFHPTTVQPMQIWHNGNNAQYLRLLKTLNCTDRIKYLPIACEDYEKPEEPEILNYPDFK